MIVEPRKYYCEGCGKYLGNEDSLYKNQHDETKCFAEKMAKESIEKALKKRARRARRKQ